MDEGVPLVFDLPPALRGQGFALRPETDADLPFLMELFASTRREEFAALGLPALQLEALLRGQFDAQRRHYRGRFPHCRFDVLTARGKPIGRLYLDPREKEVCIVDISLLPARRGRGLGSAILRALKDHAGAAGGGVSLMVAKPNPAFRLYRREGFSPVADHGLYVEMDWRPAAAGRLQKVS